MPLAKPPHTIGKQWLEEALRESPRRAVDVFGVLFRRAVSANPRLLSLATGESLAHLRAIGSLDAPELARRLMADHRQDGATAATCVARAAVDFCTAYGVEL